MPDRPQNFCHDCGYQWFPRGNDVSRRCPACRSGRVGAALSLDNDPPPQIPAAGGGSAVPLALGIGMLACVLMAAAGVAVYLTADGPAPAKPEPEVAAARPDPAPAPAPAPVEPKGPEPKPDPPPAPKADPPAPKADPPPEPVAKKEAVPEVKTPVEPEPKVAPKADLAPPAPLAPRAAYPFPPPAGWESEWQRIGDVKARLIGAAPRRVPLLDRKQKKLLSTETFFVVWVELENVSAAAPKTYRRWQPVLTGECTLRTAGGAAVPYAIFPTETGREWFGDFNRELPPGGPAVIESLVFARPDPTSPGPLTLTLDATRVGGSGWYEFVIPNAVWTRP